MENEQSTGFSIDTWSASIVGEGEKRKADQRLLFARSKQFSDELKNALSIVANQAGRNIVVLRDSILPSVASEETYKQEEHLNIYVHCFAIPNGLKPREWRQYDCLSFNGNKYKLSGSQTDAIIPDIPKGSKFLEIKSDKVGDKRDVVALVNGHHLYLLFDVLDCTNGIWSELQETDEKFEAAARETCQLFVDIVSVYLDYAVANNLLIDYKPIEEEKEKKNFDTFVSLLKSGSKKQVVTIESSIKNIMAQADSYISEAAKAYALLKNEQARLAVAIATSEGHVDKRCDVFKNLLKYSYKYIKMNSETIIEASTKSVYVRHPIIDDKGVVHNRIFYVGQFKVTIDLNNVSSSGVTIQNITPKKILVSGVERMIEHPHIQGGRVCWGNLASSVAKLLGQGDYLFLLQLVGQYLFAYNEGDAYNKITLFDDVTEMFDDVIVYDNSAAISGKTQQGEEVAAVLTRNRNN